ncbi:endonuclease [Shewanella sp. GXUN23E]|uniref:endonuclease n=1 Tax=Shewanella sp. GXUN23E TaxID=3422498 RepID=UPI003D7D4ADD
MKTHPTKIALALMALGGFSAQASANLVITEYIEGSSNNKAVEISNLGNTAVDLSANEYKLVLFTNGKTDPGNTATLSGVLAPNTSVVFHNAGAADPFKIGTDSTVTYFNGDDALVLYKDNVVIDRFGKLGEDPGTEWTDPNNPNFSTANKTLRRNADVTVGDTDATAAFPGTANQWTVFDIDTADGLGCPGVGACTKSPGVLLITEYIEGSSNNKVVELSNVGGSAIDLTANEYKLVLFTNGGIEPKSTEILTGTLQPGSSYVFHNSSAADAFKIGAASTVTYFNGDDALVLYKDDAVIDRIGKLGEDPGAAWLDPNNPDFSTADRTLRRKATVTAGDTVADAPFPGEDNQWVVFAKDTADGIGCPGEGTCDVLPPEPDPNLPCNGCVVLDKVADAAAFKPELYYADVLGGNLDTPQAWKAALSGVITQNHQPLTYKGVWTVLTYSDEDPANPKNIIELYTGNSVSKHDNGGLAGDWNREHVWPKSHGFPQESQWGYTDAHHLRPTDVAVNGARGALDFDAVAGLEGTTEVTGAPGNYRNTALNAFEPRDAVKGDVARMMFYMDTRYELNGNGGMPDLLLVDNTGTSGAQAGKLCTLYQWHLQDPVDDADKKRNNAVYEYQGNRNPYIDYPEWVQQVYGAACGDAPLPGLDVTFVIEGPTTVVEGESISLDASKSSVADGQSLTYSWKQVSGPEMSLVADGALLTMTAPLVDSTQAVVIELTATAGELSATHQLTLTLADKVLELDIQFKGPTLVNEGDAVSIEATPAQTSTGDAVTYTWSQIGGPKVEFAAQGAQLSFTAPQVTLNTDLLFSVEAFDGKHSATKQLKVQVNNQAGAGWEEPEGGAMGALLTLLLPLAFWRRRQR